MDTELFGDVRSYLMMISELACRFQETDSNQDIGLESVMKKDARSMTHGRIIRRV